MGEWKESILSDIAEIIMGQSPKGDTCNSVGLGLPLLNGPTEFGVKNPDPIQFTEDPKRLSDKNDILFCVRGSTTGRMNWADQRYAIGRGIAAIRHKNGYDYKYFIKGIIDFNLPMLLSSATGSTFPNISRGQLEDLEILIPPLPEQKAIASVLSSLDDKIDLLHRQNKTLESMAETLFRQWFVEEARDDWGTIKVSDVIDVLSGFAFKSTAFNESGKFRLITIKAVQDGYLELSGANRIDEIPSKMPDYCCLKKGDILLSLTGNVGRCCMVDAHGLLLNQRVAKLRAKNERNWAFAYIMFRQSSMKQCLEEMAKGTAQANLSPIDTAKMEMSSPPINMLDLFNSVATPVLQRVLFNKKQIRTLEKLRDTLLPKLMSGEVRVEYEH